MASSLLVAGRGASLAAEIGGMDLGDVQVEAADSAEQCLLRVRENHVRILVLHQELPDQPGIEVLRRVREIRPSLAVVFCAAVPTPEVELEARRLGTLFYAVLPWVSTTMERVLRGAAKHETRFYHAPRVQTLAKGTAG